MFKKSILVCVLAVVLCNLAIAQDNEPNMLEHEASSVKAADNSMWGYFSFGGLMLDFDNLNARLKKFGYTELSDDFVTLGFGFVRIKNRVMVGGEFQFLLGTEESDPNVTTKISGNYGFLNLGYIVLIRRDENVEFWGST